MAALTCSHGMLCALLSTSYCATPHTTNPPIPRTGTIFSTWKNVLQRPLWLARISRNDQKIISTLCPPRSVNSTLEMKASPALVLYNHTVTKEDGPKYTWEPHNWSMSYSYYVLTVFAPWKNMSNSHWKATKMAIFVCACSMWFDELVEECINNCWVLF